MIKISPSILQADFTNLKEVIEKLESAGSDFIHLDVMDGNFVDTITFGPKMVADIRKITRLPLDVHLMILNPERHIKAFADAGADIINVHQEAANALIKCLESIKEMGIKCSVSIKPSTSIDTLKNVLSIVDMILIMTVEPGKGGQSLIKEALEKIRDLKQIKEENGYSYDLQVDGGIKAHNKNLVVSAGANIIVAGSAITGSDDYKKAIAGLKGE